MRQLSSSLLLQNILDFVCQAARHSHPISRTASAGWSGAKQAHQPIHREGISAGETQAPGQAPTEVRK